MTISPDSLADDLHELAQLLDGIDVYSDGEAATALARLDDVIRVASAMRAKVQVWADSEA